MRDSEQSVATLKMTNQVSKSEIRKIFVKGIDTLLRNIKTNHSFVIILCMYLFTQDVNGLKKILNIS